MKQGTTIRGSYDPDRVRAIQKALPTQARDTEKKLNYFMVPAGRRHVEYEQLIGYTQQSSDFAGGGLEIGEYQQKHPGGRGAYANETTELKTRDWFKFRDPERTWFYPLVKNKSEDGRTTDRFLMAASTDGRVRQIDPEWLPFLEKDLGVLTLYEYGLFNAHASAVKDSLSDFVKTWVAIAAFHKDDAAQMVQYERVFLSKQVGGFSAGMEAAQDVWMKSPVYSAMRKAVEKLWGETYDWGEIVWASHAILDPIIGQFMRREFWQAIAPSYGDSLTPWMLNQACVYHQSTKLGAREFFGSCLVNDPDFGALNRAIITAWTQKWLPLAIEGLKGFLGIYEHLPQVSDRFATKEAVGAAVGRVISDWTEDFASIPGYSVSSGELIAAVMAGYPNVYWKAM